MNRPAAQFGVRPTLTHARKKQFLAGVGRVLACRAETAGPSEDKTPERYEQFGRLKAGLNWVKTSCHVRLTGCGRRSTRARRAGRPPAVPAGRAEPGHL